MSKLNVQYGTALIERELLPDCKVGMTSGDWEWRQLKLKHAWRLIQQAAQSQTPKWCTTVEVAVGKGSCMNDTRPTCMISVPWQNMELALCCMLKSASQWSSISLVFNETSRYRKSKIVVHVPTYHPQRSDCPHQDWTVQGQRWYGLWQWCCIQRTPVVLPVLLKCCLCSWS